MTLEKAKELAKQYYYHHKIECNEDLVLESMSGNKLFVFWNTSNPNYYCKVEIIGGKIYLDIYEHVACSWVEII